MQGSDDLYDWELEEMERQAHVSYGSKTHTFELELESEYLYVEFYLTYKIVYDSVVSWTLKYNKDKYSSQQNKEIESYLKNHESEMVDFMVDHANF
jgi:hypothetical protein